MTGSVAAGQDRAARAEPLAEASWQPEPARAGPFRLRPVSPLAAPESAGTQTTCPQTTGAQTTST